VGFHEENSCPPEGVDTGTIFNGTGKWQSEDGNLTFIWARAEKGYNQCCVGPSNGFSKAEEEKAKKEGTSATWNAEKGTINWWGHELCREDVPEKTP